MTQQRRSRTYLEGATYDMREYVKRLGGRWDKERKAWYVLGDVPELLGDLVQPEPGKAPRFPMPFAPDMEDKPQPKAVTKNGAAKAMLRKPPLTDAQADFFVPALYDIGSKETRLTMDLALFRLSKKDLRAGQTLRYVLPDGFADVQAGAAGMASIWDYDIVLMAISHLTEAMNRYRAGGGELPSRKFRPHVSEILKFCRKGDGGRQADEIAAALNRLSSTMIRIVRRGADARGRPMQADQAEGLLNSYKVLSYTDSNKLAAVEITLPEWLYQRVVEGEKPEVLTVHRDYFLIDAGIGRFLYRLARQHAGKGRATWYFKTIYEHSGSTGTLKKFTENLRRIVQANDLPEYGLVESKGQAGPLLVMSYREAAPAALLEDAAASPQ
ncbi:replication initiator protein A [Novosphingobium sp. FKTRR1]|uniref:replication initiator protein A n=1 Tax=Novosphingobium sp. FKTRR1 TaxID=2879118 RepID=UPI001CEFF4ED|nr:replication initiator protein A [Novosphingobium sp. FKTRR1]